MLAIATSSVHAEDGGTTRILVGFPAGGTTDLMARMVAEHLRADSGRSAIVDNKPGAAGRVAAIALKNAAPDGNTLLLTPAVVPVMAPLLLRDIGYDPIRDFAPVSHLAAFRFGLAVAADHPAHTLQEFVVWAREHPAQMTIGTLGNATAGHFLVGALARATGTHIEHVAYVGIAPLASDLLGNRLAAGVDALSNLVELRAAGRVRVLATSGAQRSAVLPDVPTFVEQGYPTVVGGGWLALYAPAGTPGSRLAQLSKAAAQVVRIPDNAAKLRRAGLEPTGTTGQELAAIMAADVAHWQPLIRASGFVAQ